MGRRSDEYLKKLGLYISRVGPVFVDEPVDLFLGKSSHSKQPIRRHLVAYDHKEDAENPWKIVETRKPVYCKSKIGRVEGIYPREKQERLEKTERTVVTRCAGCEHRSVRVWDEFKYRTVYRDWAVPRNLKVLHNLVELAQKDQRYNRILALLWLGAVYQNVMKVNLGNQEAAEMIEHWVKKNSRDGKMRTPMNRRQLLGKPHEVKWDNFNHFMNGLAGGADIQTYLNRFGPLDFVLGSQRQEILPLIGFKIRLSRTDWKTLVGLNGDEEKISLDLERNFRKVYRLE